MASLSTDESSVPAPAPTDQDGPGPREDGPYILRPLLEGVPLVADGSEKNVKINCVEFHGMMPASSGILGLFWSVINQLQMATSISAHRAPRSFTSFKFHPILLITTQSPCLSLPRGSLRFLQIHLRPQVVAPECRKYCCYHESAKPACSVIGPLHSTLCRN